MTTKKGVGASLRRKEDARYLTGRGQFVGGHPQAGHARSRFPALAARARTRRSTSKSRRRSRTACGSWPTSTASNRSAPSPPSKGFKASDQWPLAKDKVRHVGEPVAMCVGATRAEAEDIAARVCVDYEELPAVVDMIEARLRPPALVHDEWGDNVFLETLVDDELADVRTVGRNHDPPSYAHGAAGDVAARRPRRALRMERPARPARDAQLRADASHQSRGTLGMPRPRPGVRFA